jgi:hypothetical protein
MKHPSIQELFHYWNIRRGKRPAPDRSEIEPGAIRRVLADTFILGIDPGLGHPFRIAGTRVCAAFGRELKGEAFTRLWAPESQAGIRAVLGIVAGESVGIVAGASAVSRAGAPLKLELLVLPLAQRDGAKARVLGALVPAEIPYWLGTEALGTLTLGPTRYLGSETQAASAPRLVSAAGHARRGLVVHDGGHA